jgi:rhodanese-related sulfurtransferase
VTRIIRLAGLVVAVAVAGAGMRAAAADRSAAISGSLHFIEVSPRTAYELVQQNSHQFDFVILDVRTPEEFASGHLAGAINLDFRASGFSHRLAKLDRGKTYLVYCRNGHRSRRTIGLMETLGFSDVYHMPAGIIGWEKLDYPEVTGSASPKPADTEP